MCAFLCDVLSQSELITSIASSRVFIGGLRSLLAPAFIQDKFADVQAVTN